MPACTRRQTLTLDVPEGFEIDRLARVVNRRRVDDVAVLVGGSTTTMPGTRRRGAATACVLAGDVPDPLLAGRVWWCATSCRCRRCNPPPTPSSVSTTSRRSAGDPSRRPANPRLAGAAGREAVAGRRASARHAVGPPARVRDRGPGVLPPDGAVDRRVLRGRGQGRSPARVRRPRRRDRNASVSPAPPDGLTLWDVTYP